MPDVTGLVRDHGYWVLAVVVLLENAGIPVPGETALLAAGYFTSPDGGRHLHLWAVALVAFAAAVVGDNVGYWLGRRVARPRLAAGRRFLFLTPERMRVAEGYFEKYGVATVFFGRFVAVLRIAAGPAAGASGMPWGRFLVANAGGALCWAVAIAAVGHFAGHAWESLHTWLGRGAWLVLAAVVLGFAGWRVAWYLRKRHRPAVAAA